MKCPYCEAEMTKGLLMTNGGMICWELEEKSIIIPSKQGIQLDYRPLKGARVENVYRCEKCRKIIFSY